MPALTLQADVTVLLRRAAKERYAPLTVFCLEHGSLPVHQRATGGRHEAVLDLFDDADAVLTSSNQGRTWFVSEARTRRSRRGIGRSYDTLRAASAFAEVVSKNAVPEEGRTAVRNLMRQVLDAFDSSPLPPVVIHLKALYAFAQGEGYPVRQHWLDGLSSSLRPLAERIIRTPLADLAGEPGLAESSTRILGRLEDYLRAHTEILID